MIRPLVLGVGFAAACNSASSTSKEKPVSPSITPATATTGAAPQPSAGNVAAPYTVISAPAPFVVAGDRIVEATARGVVLRDRTGGETDVIAAAANAKAIAALPDGAVAVATGDKVHVVKGTTIAASYGAYVPAIAATGTASELWAIDGNLVSREMLDAAKGRAVAKKAFPMPEGRRPGYATLDDGSLVIEHQSGVYRATATELTLYAYDARVQHLAPGPATGQIWCTIDNQATVAALGEGKLEPRARYGVGVTETIVHLAAAGTRAAAVVARGDGPVSFFAVGFDAAKGEVWRQPLGSVIQEYVIAVDTATVAVRGGATFKTFDAASGAPR